MKKATKSKSNSTDIVIKTDMSFEQIMKKALNTPIPKKEKKAKKK